MASVHSVELDEENIQEIIFINDCSLIFEGICFNNDFESFSCNQLMKMLAGYHPTVL